MLTVMVHNAEHDYLALKLTTNAICTAIVSKELNTLDLLAY